MHTPCSAFAISFLVAAFSSTTPAFAGSEKPAALVAAEQARDRAWLRTAHIEFSEHRTVPRDTDPPSLPPRVQYYTWRCAGDDYTTVYRGDDEGVVMRGLDGLPRDDLTYRGPMHFLVQGGEIWQHVEDDVTADILPDERTTFWRLWDLRTMGLNPVVFGKDFGSEVERCAYPAPEYTTASENELTVVTASTGSSRVVWWIDPQKDNGIVRTAVWLDGKQIGETRYALEETDGVWFPRKIELYRLAAGDVTPSTVITILSAEFNRPYHPQSLTPASIGIEPGTTVICQTRAETPVMIWDGKKLIGLDEYSARLQSGELRPGPTITREHERLTVNHANDGIVSTQPVRSAVVLDVRILESQWEAYTRGFIVRYRLDTDQARKAWDLCRGCEEKARAYLAKRQREIEEWQQQADSAKSGRVSADRLGQLKERQTELAAPIERIFDDRLKPGLERLPTDAQRLAVREHSRRTPYSGEDRR